MAHSPAPTWIRRAAQQAAREIPPDELNRRAYAAGVAPQVMREWLQAWALECPRRLLGV